MVHPEKPKFVVGLGNPGRQYVGTRHNIGFLVVEELVRKWNGSAGRSAFGGVLHDARVEKGPHQAKVLLLTPQTYMNRSGGAVRELATFYKAAREDLLVVLDDLALPVGRLRLRAGGSAGGHNGLADILAALGSDQVPRLRIGIGSCPPMMDSADYVLSAFAKDEQPVIRAAVVLAAQAVEDWVFQGIDAAMETYNRKMESEEGP